MSEAPQQSRGDLGPILLAIGIFAALSIASSVTSDGFLEADACTHYLFARFALQEPHFLVNVWGRPVCTGIYAIPAIWGRSGVHLMSLALAIGCGLIAWRIARNQQYRWPALALIFTLAQPLVFLHSFSELTELPFAFLLALGFWAYQSRQWAAMASVIALTPLSRPEGIGFVAIAAIALVVHLRWFWIPILFVPMVIWNYAGWTLSGKPGESWRWLISEWPYSVTSLYERGSVLQFIGFLPAVVSPFIFPATVLGVWRSLQKKHWNSLFSLAHGPGYVEQSQVHLLIALIPLSILLAHSILFATGKLASSGELRYLLIVAPFWALLSAKGWEWLWIRLNGTRPMTWAGVAALLQVIFNAYYRVIPLIQHEDWKQAQRAVVWYQDSALRTDFPNVTTSHQAIFYYLDRIPTDWQKQTLARPAPGTIVFWDPIYSIYNSDAKRSIPLEELLVAGWIDVTDPLPKIGKDWHILLSPQDAHGRDAQASPHFPSPP
jgi:hypothetical protein